MSLRAAGRIDGPGQNGRGHPLEPFPPATLRRAPPPAWWIAREEERFEALFPNRTPTGEDPFRFYAGRHRMKGLWADRATLAAAGTLAIICADLLIFQIWGRSTPFFAFLAPIPLFFLLRSSRLLVSIQRARESGLLQALLLANYHFHLIDVLRSIRHRAYRGLSPLLWGGFLGGLVYFAFKQRIQFIPILGGSLLGSGLLSGVLAALIFSRFTGDPEESYETNEGNRFSLGLAYYLSHSLRRMPPILTAVLALALPFLCITLIVFIPLLGALVADYLFGKPGSTSGIYIFMLLMLSVSLPMAEGARRYVTKRMERSTLHEDVGEWP